MRVSRRFWVMEPPVIQKPFPPKNGTPYYLDTAARVVYRSGEGGREGPAQ